MSSEVCSYIQQVLRTKRKARVLQFEFGTPRDWNRDWNHDSLWKKTFTSYTTLPRRRWRFRFFKGTHQLRLLWSDIIVSLFHFLIKSRAEECEMKLTLNEIKMNNLTIIDREMILQLHFRLLFIFTKFYVFKNGI